MDSESLMCLICADIAKGNMNSLEARRNLGEIHSSMKKEHILEVLRKIWELEDEEE